MNTRKPLWRLLAMLLSVLLLFTAWPVTSAVAAPASDIPAYMLDNEIIRALEYTGYDVQRQKDTGTIFQYNYYGSRLAKNDPQVLSDIGYGGTPSGLETVTDSSTVSGKAPNIAKFEQYGLVCASWIAYFVGNYLPNIEGKDTGYIMDAVNATGYGVRDCDAWKDGLDALVKQGKVVSAGTSSSNVNYSIMVPGDIIMFGNSTDTSVHVAVYAGAYGGYHMIIHVGNERGPEIGTVEAMNAASQGDKRSTPSGFYHLSFWEEDGTIEVYKKDTAGKALAGATFKAVNSTTGQTFYIGPTNNSGYAKTEDLIPYGTYTVTETVFPTGYRASGQSSWTVTLNSNTANATVTINAVNEQIPGAVKIVKTSEDGVVSGVSMRITGNGVDQTVTTGTDGTVTVSNLKPGTYTVTETVGSVYVPQESRSVTVVSNQTATVTFNNVLKRGVLRVTKTAEDGLVEGVTFRLYGTSASGLAVDAYAVTDATGVAVFKDVLIAGYSRTYTLEEVNTAARYEVPLTQEIPIVWNTTSTATVDNVLKRGSLRVTKTSEDGRVEGVTFCLSGTALNGEAVHLYAVTDAAGVAVFEDVLISGAEPYTVQEVDTADRYEVPAEQDVAIEWNTTATATFHNALKRGSLRVTKTAEDGRIEGVQFHLYGTSYSGLPVDVYATTDAAGVAVFEDVLISGAEEYTLEEVDVPDRYLPVAAQTAAIEWKVETAFTTATFENLLRKGTVKVTKTSEDGLVAGMKFHLYGTSYSGLPVDLYATTDASGVAVFRDVLISGITPYTLEEVETADRYRVPAEQYVEVTWNGTSEKSFRNVLKKGCVELYKTDSVNGRPVADAVYSIFDAAGTRVGALITDQNGYAKSPLLTYATGYYLLEYSAPNGFLLDNTPIYFDIVEDLVTVTLTTENDPPIGLIEVEKRGEVLVGASIEETETGGLYTPVYEDQGLAGAVFEIVALEDIVVNGVVMETAESVVATITTDATGCARASVYLGRYRVREISAPYGYYLGEHNVFDVTLDYAGQTVPVVSEKLQAANDRQKAHVLLNKQMEENEVYPYPDAYQSVLFGLYAGEDVTDVAGTVVIPAGSLVGLCGVDETGAGIFTTDLPIGYSWYVKELATAEGYWVDTGSYEVVFRELEQTLPEVDLWVNEGEPILNTVIRGTLEICKISKMPEAAIEQGFANKPLAGAVYGVYTVDGKLVIKLAPTDAEGYARLEAGALPWGEYILKEITPPQHFELDLNEYPFSIGREVDDSGEPITCVSLQVSNEPMIGTITPTYSENPVTEGSDFAHEQLPATSAPSTGEDPRWILAAGWLLSVAAMTLLTTQKIKKGGASRE